jgi:hypothetical protein
MADESDDSEPGDPAKAFDDLRAEVALQRRAVEALGDVLEAHPAPDLSIDIARILKGQAQLLEVLEKHPALQLTPVQYGQAIADAGSSVIRNAAQQLQRATQEIEQERSQLVRLIGTVRYGGQQRHVLAWTGSLALVAGLLLSPLLMRSLPVSLNSHVAAFVLGEDRWGAGSVLMQVARPDQWPTVVEAFRLVRSNDTTLAVCREAAIKTKRDQRCTVTVSP